MIQVTENEDGTFELEYSDEYTTIFVQAAVEWILLKHFLLEKYDDPIAEILKLCK